MPPNIDRLQSFDFFLIKIKSLPFVTDHRKGASNRQMLLKETEHIVIEGIRKGDLSRAHLIVDHYKEMVHQVCYRILLNDEEAEEATQDSFLKAFEAIDQFRGDAKFSTWLFRIAYNMALGRYRKNHRRSAWEWITDKLPDFAHTQEADHFELEEQSEIISHALHQLNEKDRAIVTLYYLEEIAVKEIAEIVDLSPNLVKVRLHRSRKKMATYLKEPENRLAV